MTIRAMMAVIVLTALVSSSRAEAGRTLEWSSLCFYGPSGVTIANQPAGTHLDAVGVISGAESPLDYLQPQDSTREYTMYISGLVSQGTITSGPPGAQTYTTVYNGGAIEVFEDLTPDHDFGTFPPNATVPSTFVDGDLMLEGQFWYLLVETNDFSFSRVGGLSGYPFFYGFINCTSDVFGTLSWAPDAAAPGYLFGHNGWISLDCADPAATTTWGRIKATYH
jgi:hypothetical protein